MDWINKPMELVSSTRSFCAILICAGKNTSCWSLCQKYKEPCPKKAFQRR